MTVSLPDLYWIFFKVGIFSFGGGYASLPLMYEDIVNKGLISMQDFQNLLAISQMTPGPIALNAATFIGTKLGGIWGSIIATLGIVTPSFIIVLILALLYYKFKNMKFMKAIIGGLRPCTVALIGGAGLSILMMSIFQSQSDIILSNIDYVALVLFFPSLFVLLKYRINPILIMLADGLIGGVIYLLI